MLNLKVQCGQTKNRRKKGEKCASIDAHFLILSTAKTEENEKRYYNTTN